MGAIDGISGAAGGGLIPPLTLSSGAATSGGGKNQGGSGYTGAFFTRGQSVSQKLAGYIPVVLVGFAAIYLLKKRR